MSTGEEITIPENYKIWNQSERPSIRTATSNGCVTEIYATNQRKFFGRGRVARNWAIVLL